MKQVDAASDVAWATKQAGMLYEEVIVESLRLDKGFAALMILSEVFVTSVFEHFSQGDTVNTRKMIDHFHQRLHKYCDLVDQHKGSNKS